MNIAKRILSKSDPASCAFVDLGDTTISYAGLSECLDVSVSRLIDEGVRFRDRVALLTPRGPSGLLGFLAVSSIATCCPIDPRLRRDEVQSALEALSVCAIVDATAEPMFPELAGSLGLRFMGMTFSARSDVPPSRPGRNRPRQPQGQMASADDIALILQTSGTTSRPKLVPLSHANILAAAEAIGRTYRLSASDICLNPMPHHHVHGLISAGVSSLVAGSAQYCAGSFSPAAIESALRELEPTWFTGSPAFHLGLLDHFKFKENKPHAARLRFVRSSSAPFPASAIRPYESLFQAPLLENYGMTESASTICSNPLPPRARKVGSVGIAIGAEIRVVGADGNDKLNGEVGEIVIRGPSIITSYAAAESNVNNFSENWLRTGDIGRFDDDRYLFVLGRLKEMIKRGGHPVFPMEVDSALVAHPDVVEAISFAISHPTLGEELVAAIVPRTGVEVKTGQLRAFLEEKLSTFKIPNAIFCVSSIPKNATGKSVRRDMPKLLHGLFEPQRCQPSTATERLLLQQWQDVLARCDFGVTDNIFVLGADPLRAERVCGAISEIRGARIAVKDILRNPTVRQQSELVEALINHPTN
jgi:acyl-CoA synthetase (AMP-forming)/AMP-acid ligase II